MAGNTQAAVEDFTTLPSFQAQATAHAAAALVSKAVWRQDCGAWWIKQPSGVWAPEAVEEVGADIADAIYDRWPDKLGSSLVSSVKSLLAYSLAKSPSIFDRDPWLLGVDNGIVDLRTGELITGGEHYITRSSPIEYVPGSVSKTWLAHIEMLFDGDAELAHCFQKLIGASLVGDAETQKPQFFVCLVGQSGGGKGLTTHTLRWVLGSNAATLRSQDFTDGADRHTQWLTRLRGARIAVVEELKGKALDVALLKMLSGGDSVVANEMRQADKEWTPSHTLVFTSNTAPDFGDDRTACAVGTCHCAPGLHAVMRPETTPDGSVRTRRESWPGVSKGLGCGSTRTLVASSHCVVGDRPPRRAH